ncbi:MAG TPA: hypothetical protein VL017_10555 [Devosia sp.]|nr:hypothetical protein [Sphingomonadaceae bacterium]HTO29019.1 hypothetical protein [Devosia sp.]
MLLSFSVSLIWLLAMLAGAAALQDCRRSRGTLIAAALAFAGALTAAHFVNPQPNWVGVIVGLLASWRLIAGPLPRAAAWIAGACAGLAAALQIAGGVSLLLAAGVTGAALGAALLLTRPGSRSGTMRGAALVAAALGAPVAGLASDLLFGWRSATMLAQDTASATAPHPPMWAIAIVVLALAAGLLKGMWIKR